MLEDVFCEGSEKTSSYMRSTCRNKYNKLNIFNTNKHGPKSGVSKATGHNKFVRRGPTLSGVGGLSKTPPIS